MKGIFLKKPNPSEKMQPQWLEKPLGMTGDRSSNSVLCGTVQEGEVESLLSQGTVLFLELRDAPL